ncbi:MAG: hypothetical protein RL635_780 [Chloroflexota bacterium]|jgi:hypothetical protein|nr:MAG: hypothetical protein DWI64_06780 [Chloroflexota bacterium]RLT51947.1 MAG: hypothetical protein DWI67_06630 [Chloroflexota bacterium]
MRFLQNHPQLLAQAYNLTRRALLLVRGWLQPGGRMQRAFVAVEAVSKGALFDCRMCGQCVLHSTGMTCPMTCPKNLRNGPCGGVRLNGNCEILPDMPCVWVLAWERSKLLPVYGSQILHVLPPLDRRLEGSSAWINDFSGAADRAAAGWQLP